MGYGRILSVANSLIGKVPYVWGGEDLKGMDCSGFIYYVFNKAGYKIPRLTAQGYYNKWKKFGCIAKCVGDLLFFGKSTSKITHVGIYLGNGYMIESGGGGSSNTLSNPGVGVRKRSVRSDLVATLCIDDILYSIDGKSPSYTTTEKGVTKMDLPLLKSGSTCNEVLMFEIIAKCLGHYSGNIDKTNIMYGPKCISACKAIQKEGGLKQDGKCGEDTWKYIMTKRINY